MLKSPRFAPLLAPVLLLISCLAASPPLAAQEPPAPAAAPAAPTAATAPAQARRISLEQLVTLREDLAAGLEQVGQLMDVVDVTQADQWLEESPLERLQERAAQTGLAEAERGLWQQALENEQAAVERIRGALNRAGLALAGEQRLEIAQAQVQAMISAWDEPAGGEAQEERTLSRIEQDIAALNARRTQVSVELTQRRQTLASLEEQLRGQAATLEQMLREREQTLAAPAQQAGEAVSAEAVAAARDAADRRSRARIIATQLDSQSMPARIERLRLEIRAHELEEIWLGGRLLAMQAEFNLRSTEELRALNRSIQTLIEREPGVQQRFDQQLGVLHERIDDIDLTQGRIRALQLEREDYLRTENDLRQTLTNVNERLELSGLTETLGSLFLEEQRRLRALDDLRFTLRDLERELSQSRLRDITLREQMRSTPEPFPSGSDDSAQEEIERLQYETIRALVQSEESLTDQLAQTEVQLRAVVALVEELDQILRETLIWWPSHVPVGLEWSKRIAPAVLALLEPQSWQEIRGALLDVTVNSPVGTLFTLVLVLGLYHGGRGTRGHLRELAEKTRHRFTDNMKLTFKAMGWSLLRVLPVPALLICTSYRLLQISGTSPGVEGLAVVLFSAAIWWLAGHLLLLFTGRNGVGTVHFEWDSSTVRRLRRNLSWYLPTQFLLIIGLALAFAHPSDLVFDVMGRAGLVAVGIFTGVLAWRLLAPNPEVRHSARFERRRRLARLGTVTFAAAVVILSLAGYLLTVSELLNRVIYTAVVIGLVWLGYRLATRALLLSEIRLRIRRLREERAKAAAIENNSPAGEGVDVPEPHLSMEDINHQTRTLVRVTAAGALVLALFWVWADILPALNWLDGVELWKRTVTDETGAEVISSITLQDGLLALFLGALLVMATRNLPGLVEILLTRATDMDPPGRYTVATLLRYFIIVIMVVSVFSLLGLRWGELQWMVAALTLGLGFGLQEVVANFVSGLIMLFERPVRVGDTITIGEFSGTVGKIRTRATTLIDWDNREVVVPNKNFITERLINWTLTDTVTRIVLPVGVSYDADVDLVMATLQEVAEAHPLVLKEPPPQVFFLRFGDSSLSFELRVFVNQLRDRLQTISELHRTIIRLFRERGVEIAFPQMDLHIRDIPAAMQRQTTAMPALGELAPETR